MDWLRWYQGTVTDPKWRFVASLTGAKVGDVIAVWACMMEHANKADNRGTLEGWRDKVYAMLLDLSPEMVGAIRAEMQDLVLNGEALTAWEKRQPSSTERVRKHRAMKRVETHETHETPRREEKRGEEILKPSIYQSVGAGALAMDDEQRTSLVIRLANRGMSENPTIDPHGFRPILPSHGRSRQTVSEWRNGGVDWTTIEATVYDKASKYDGGKDSRYQQIGTLSYFTSAVLEAHERQAAMQVEAPSIAGVDTLDDRLAFVPAGLREWAERLDTKLQADEIVKSEAERVLAHLRSANEQEVRRMRVAEREAFLWIRLLNWYGERVGDPRPERAVA